MLSPSDPDPTSAGLGWVVAGGIAQNILWMILAVAVGMPAEVLPSD